MKTHHLVWNSAKNTFDTTSEANESSFVIYFGPNDTIQSPTFQSELRRICPQARLIGCTAGTVIAADDYHDDATFAVACELEHTQVRLESSKISVDASESVGRKLGETLGADNLSGVLVLCDSLNVDGVALVEGLRASLPPNTPISGGLASDGANFIKTVVGADSLPSESMVAVLGFYGDHFEMRQAHDHGWNDFGPPRRITRSSGAQLLELDGKPALELYKYYLGEAEAADLPGSALRYPLLIWNPESPEDKVIRTVLNVDENNQSLTFASTVPEGWHARLMRGVFEHLADGARSAARQIKDAPSKGGETPEDKGLALLVSCVGRRILMGQHVYDEIDAASELLGSHFSTFGFYSAGEISMPPEGAFCGLHNQTMTILSMREVA